MALIDRRLLRFLLYDWLDADALAQRDRFAEHSRDTFDAMLEAADTLASSEFAPHNRAADVSEPRFDGERVHLIPEIGRALDAFVAGGFMGATADAAYGGLQLPALIEKACFAHFDAANVATAAYAMLTIGNANLLLAHGTARQIDVFARPQLTGRFFGTMCLSEPQAGSSLSDIRTRAEPDGSGSEDCPLGARYRLRGTKMWISCGEHELSGNIVHLVLAKVPQADGSLPAGVKGISLFIVPRVLVSDDGSLGERNDVALAGLNHKMGYRGTVNTVLNFGEGRFRPQGGSGAIGYRVGAEGQGLSTMFHMMNEARIGVGLGATMLGYSGYRSSLEYARQRPQGRPVGAGGKDPAQPQVAIIEHADVRRMLLAQKAYTEGALALNLYCARLVDEEKTAADAADRAQATLLLDMLTPIAKSWPSQWCLEANNLAIQVLGGYGYTRDFPVEQCWRDNRLNMIHEGTHGIQALDLLGRKVAMQQGAGLALLGGTIAATIVRADAAAHPDTRRFAADLKAALRRIELATRKLWELGDPEATLAHATPYMQAFGHVVLAWIWLELSLTASRIHTPADDDFLHGIWHACRYFFVYELPQVTVWLGPAESGDATLIETRDAWL
ncbi:MAG: acyl-CoA dehydrogenase [Gemmatimonadota bacterium]